MAVISLLTALAVMAPGGPAKAAPPGPEFFGVNAQGLFPYQEPSAWPVHLNAMAANGIRIVRYDAAWNTIEPRPPLGGAHRFDWRVYDQIVGAMAAAGLRWYPVLDYSAAWAASRPGNVKSAPASAEAYAVFAAALAERYGRDGSFWREHPELPTVPVTSYEIWNEENSNYFWQPQPDAAAYAALYLSARDAIHAVDPDAQAVVGGLVPNRDAAGFLLGMVSARPDMAGNVDAVALHPYAQTPQGVAASVLATRSTLELIGLHGVPIEITEVGWTTRGPGSVSDDVRAANYAWVMRWAYGCSCGVSRLIAHTWVSSERRPDAREDWFGLYHPDGQPTATGLEFGEVVRRAGEAPAPAHAATRRRPIMRAAWRVR